MSTENRKRKAEEELVPTEELTGSVVEEKSAR